MKPENPKTKYLGLHEWRGQQITAFILIPLFLYMLTSFWLSVVDDGSLENATNFVKNPHHTFALVLLIAVSAFHGAGELMIIVDDYIHHPFLNRMASFNIRFGATLLSTLGIGAILKISLEI